MDITEELVSVLILAYNHECFLRDCIHSIGAQDHQNIEIILFDNASTDGTRALAYQLKEEFDIPIHIMSTDQPVKNGFAFNQMSQQAKGHYLSFLSSDDLYLKNKTKEQIECFKSNKNLQIIYGNGRCYQDQIILERVHHSGIKALFSMSNKDALERLYELYKIGGFFIQTVLLKKYFFERINGFDEEVLSDDWAFNIRVFSGLKHQDEIKYLDADFFLYRQHGNNYHKNFPLQSDTMIEVVKKYVPDDKKSSILSELYLERCLTGLQVYRLKHIHLSMKFFFLSQVNKKSVKNLLKFLKVFMSAIVPLKYKLSKISNKLSKKSWII